MSLLLQSANYLGVDIGSTGIKVVELKKEKGKIKLVNYGFSEHKKHATIDWQKNTQLASELFLNILNEGGINTKDAVSALPTFSVFSSVLNLSNLDKKDIPSAVHWEAKKVIPLPLDEMILDWRVLEDGLSDQEKKAKSKNMKVLLTGAPRSLVKKYTEIFKLSEVNLLSLETETFSLIRSLLGGDKSTIMLVEIGASTTDVSIVDNNIPTLSRSIDVGGIAITKALSLKMSMGTAKAEQFKYDLCMNALKAEGVEMPEVIVDIISPIVNEIKYAINLFQNKSGKTTEKIVLSGGSALLPNICGYLSKILDKKVIIGDPWARLSYPSDLKPLLNEIGPRMAVAIGLAMRELE